MKTFPFHLIISGVVAGLLTGCVSETGKSDPAGAPKDAAKGAGTTTKPTPKVDDAKKAAPTSKPTSRPGKKVGAAPKLDEKVFEHFGDGVATGPEALAVAKLASDSGKLDGKKIRLAGKVESVCKKKGCWMILADGPNKVRVKFKDYGFFVPKDCEGREAILDGTFAVKEIPVAELKHYLEDAGKHAEAAKVTEPKREYSIMADGVALKR